MLQPVPSLLALLLVCPLFAASPEDVALQQLPATQPNGVRVRAIVEVHADREATWRALVDLQARRAGNDAIRSIVPYRPATATEQWMKWTVARFGVEVVYHNHYVVSADHTTFLHELDTSMPNDLVGSRGLYTLAPGAGGAGWTRLVYDCESDFGRALPTVVQRWMTDSGTRGFVADIARRAEAQ